MAISEEVLVPLLARRSYHLPGNSWVEDWIQWIRNNHILFGICLHHPLHPLESWERIMALLGSIAFGLAATNCAYLWDQFDPQGMQEEIIVIPGFRGTEYILTKGTLVLWTFGGLCHSIYDFSVWHIMACACCHAGGRCGNHVCSDYFKDCGSYMMIPVVFVVVVIATWAVLLRAADNGDGGGGGSDAADYYDQELDVSKIEGLESFSFLTEYSIELALTWFLYFPLLGTILFSGILTCFTGRLPVLGGRPRDIMLVKDGRIGGGSASNNGSSYFKLFG